MNDPTNSTRPKLFISHSSKDGEWAHRLHRVLREDYEVFLDSHPDDGIHPGARWEPTLWKRLDQSGGVVALCTASWLSSSWCVSEVMIARERGKTVFLLAAADVVEGTRSERSDEGPGALRVPDWLKDTQFISLADHTEEEAHRRLLDGLVKEGVRLEKGSAVSRRPYPGLEPFEARDAPLFFGRGDEIQRTREALNRSRADDARRFVLVLGASGCGKSSLVRAGVLPRLTATRRTDDARRWVVLPPFFGGQGLEGLIGAIHETLSGTSEEQTLRTIRGRVVQARDTQGQARCEVRALREVASELRAAHRSPGGHVLVVLDQLEEVFGTPDRSDARAALRLLSDASADPACRLVVLATMRSDFLNLFQLFPDATKRYREVMVNPMEKSRFAEIIEGPAERCRLRLGPGLTEALIEDTRHSDALPLLAFTLKELYDKGHEDDELTLDEYRDLFPEVTVRTEDGSETTERGVAVAVKIIAEKILEEFGYLGHGPPRDHSRMRDLRSAFLRLVEVGSEGQFTRRTARKSDMPASCGEVLTEFEKRRLLVPGEEAGEPTLEVAHEALFRVWDTLRDWLARAREDLLLRAQIKRAAEDWDGAERDETRRWPDERVVETMESLERSGIATSPPLTPLEREFLGALSPEEVLAALEDRTLTILQRARLGVRLALMGDPRRGVGLDDHGIPDLDWCDVPAGTVLLRDISREEWEPLAQELSRLRGDSVPDPAGHVEERALAEAQRSGRVEEGCQISRYPVTWVQFRAFLHAEDYGDPRWWTGLVRPAGPRREPTIPPNHPATHMTWYEASAFCRWLGARLGEEYDVRLPDEFEWQQAATAGDPRRIFPWGLELDVNYANTFDARIGSATLEHLSPTTTAVGAFPSGASPVGPLDMSGNVWEWCDSHFFGRSERRDGEGARVVRGGSWIIRLPACSNFYQGRLDPSSDKYYVGFRPVRSIRAGRHRQ